MSSYLLFRACETRYYDRRSLIFHDPDDNCRYKHDGECDLGECDDHRSRGDKPHHQPYRRRPDRGHQRHRGRLSERDTATQHDQLSRR